MRDWDYDFDDLLRVYSAPGVKPGASIFVASDLAPLMRYREPGRDEVLDAHLRALLELLGSEGTLFVPTASLNLCNTDQPFEPETTPSADMGVFSEHVRTRAHAVRSFHPFWSLAGVGPAAREILADVSRHAYGWGSVFQRFVERDVMGVNVGKAPRLAIPVIHYLPWSATGSCARNRFIYPSSMRIATSRAMGTAR
jgi:aminoglycoside 3-N-acetyltransferase